MEKETVVNVFMDNNSKISDRTREAANSLIARTNKKDPKPEDLELLRKWLDDTPSFVAKVGNLQLNLFNSLLDIATSDSALAMETAERYIAHMKTELGFHNSSFVEQMLIDEIILRWLRLVVADQDHRNATYKEHSIRVGLYCEKSLFLAQKRYLKAVETLAKVRKMIAQTQAKGAEMFKNLMEGKSSGEK